MAFDEELAERVRRALTGYAELEEKKMFGGVGFLLNGNMACGVHGQNLIVRVGPERYEETLKTSYARPFDLTGRPMKGWVYVDPDGFKHDAQLKEWILLGITFSQTLPRK